MFDWNDEELANIIWGEAGDSDDHIVPYTERSEEKSQVTYGDHKTEWKQEAATINTESKTHTEKTYGCKLESTSCFGANEGLSASGFGMESWPVLSLSDAAKPVHDSMAETAPVSKNPGTFQNQLEDKEQTDFADYDWANIGSFDDLDRMFSNDEPVFGNVSLNNADELWSSSKDNSPAIMDQTDYAGSKCKTMAKKQMALDIGASTVASDFKLAAENNVTPNEFAEKVGRQKKSLKCRKKAEEKNEGKLLQDFCGTWSSAGNQFQQLESQFAPSTLQTCPLSAFGQQNKIQGPESLQYHQMSNSILASSCGNFKNKGSSRPVLPCNFREDNQPAMLSGYEVSPSNANSFKDSPEPPVKPLSMTPQEKIEKLRRRQQMQAMLAIKRQQEQFNHQISSSDPSITQKCLQDNQIQHVEGTDTELEENLSALASVVPYSPLEQDDSNTTSTALDDYSVEETIFYRLQDIILSLDIRIRLCIRDSLFRLAQSAVQRQCASDTCSTNKTGRDEHRAAIKEEINSHLRCTTMPDMETDTNPIDRTVAQLVFHRPFDLSGKRPETTESPVSSKLQHEQKTPGLVSSMGCLPRSSKAKQNFSPHGSSRMPCTLIKPQHVDRYKSSPSIDTSENASNNEPADLGAMDVRTSR
ncbi:protein LNK2 isoform X2 [Malania oleifera]|uniref:protein LNK2 isoform X2 n=1 Tax=Malania oleifera TaxID=397392 RepID=UPI0025AE1FBA|nr:protein LNK2 isoform X2 [Malania oleifera]XP_057976603.1 protein LNK2 isoform X2 [Malania oleifera]